MSTHVLELHSFFKDFCITLFWPNYPFGSKDKTNEVDYHPVGKNPLLTRQTLYTEILGFEVP